MELGWVYAMWLREGGHLEDRKPRMVGPPEGDNTVSADDARSNG